MAGSTFSRERWAGRQEMLAFILHSGQGSLPDVSKAFFHLQNDACTKTTSQVFTGKWQVMGVVASKQIDSKEDC